MSTTTKKQKDKNTSKKKEILYKDTTSGITYYSDGSTSKIKKEAPKKEILFKDTSTGKKYYKGDQSKKKSTTSFGEAFKAARAAGKKTFIWNNNSYHTKTKDEMEKAKAKAGPKESKTYIMKQKTGMLVRSDPKKTSDAIKDTKKTDYITRKDDKKVISKEIVPEKKKKLNIFQKFTKKMRGTKPDGTTRTQKEWEEARDKRRIEKRISKMKERKNQGKNYSAKNLAELQEKIKGM